jgi:hypothetical protein
MIMTDLWPAGCQCWNPHKYSGQAKQGTIHLVVELEMENHVCFSQ